MSDSEGSEDGSHCVDKLDLILTEISNFKSYSKKKFSEIFTQNKAISDSLADFKRELKGVKDENKILKATIKEQSSRIQLLERKSIENYVCLQNIPKQKNEKLSEIFRAVARVLNIQITTSSVKALYRKKDKKDGGPGDIVIKCNTSDLSECLLSGIKSKKLMIKDLGFEGNLLRCYANKELTFEDRKLLFETKRVQAVNKWAFVWVSNNRVLIRKAEGSEAIHVDSLDKLKLLIKK